VLEYAQRLAQFRAGNIWPTIATQDDILPLKNDIPSLLIRQGDFGPTPVMVSFGYEGDSPFKDQRVRQGDRSPRPGDVPRRSRTVRNSETPVCR
jgi:hypothetical protein